MVVVVVHSRRLRRQNKKGTLSFPKEETDNTKGPKFMMIVTEYLESTLELFCIFSVFRFNVIFWYLNLERETLGFHFRL